MSETLARRGFLRQLVSLPLIGGGLTLIGQPNAVAEPVTREPMKTYRDWLNGERMRLVVEMGFAENKLACPSLLFGQDKNPGGAFHTAPDGTWASNVLNVPPSARAALVLSAVGCDWREG